MYQPRAAGTADAISPGLPTVVAGECNPRFYGCLSPRHRLSFSEPPTTTSETDRAEAVDLKFGRKTYINYGSNSRKFTIIKGIQSMFS